MASLPRNPAKMKGLLKGLRYISQIFDEEKEQEIEIGHPTDVKHVAHIGWDGPSIESPSWMKDYKSPSNFQSAPLNVPGGPQDRGESEVKWVSEDGKGEKRNKSKEEGTKSSRRHRNGENTSDQQSPKKERSRRKQHSKDSADSVRSIRQDGIDSPSKGPDIPKKSRRKKSKEYVNGGTSSGKLKSKGERGDSSSTAAANEPGGSHKSKKKGDRTSLKSDIDVTVTEKENIGIF